MDAEWREIPLSSGGVTIVDANDYEWLSRWKWKRHTGGYACRTGWDKDARKWTCILMHRLIVDPSDGLEVDHINRDKLDNTRGNLRAVTHSENVRNQSSVGPPLIYPDVKTCEMCGEDYKPNPRKRKRQKTCGPVCAHAMRTRNQSVTKRAQFAGAK